MLHSLSTSGDIATTEFCEPDPSDFAAEPIAKVHVGTTFDAVRCSLM
jgi:hypothetical protein